MIISYENFYWFITVPILCPLAGVGLVHILRIIFQKHPKEGE